MQRVLQIADNHFPSARTAPIRRLVNLWAAMSAHLLEDREITCSPAIVDDFSEEIFDPSSISSALA